MSYQKKYLKYKSKYLNLKANIHNNELIQAGGNNELDILNVEYLSDTPISINNFMLKESKILNGGNYIFGNYNNGKLPDMLSATPDSDIFNEPIPNLNHNQELPDKIDSDELESDSSESSTTASSKSSTTDSSKSSSTASSKSSTTESSSEKQNGGNKKSNKKKTDSESDLDSSDTLSSNISSCSSSIDSEI